MLTLRRLRDDSGFTLIELLLASVIIGVITLPLGNLVIEYLRTTTQTQGRLHESHDSQLTAAFFSQDVASIGVRNSSDVLTQSTGTAAIGGSAPDCASGISGMTRVLVLAWDQHSSAGAKSVVGVEYVTRSQTVGTSTELQLVRLHCTTSGSPDATTVLAHNLTAAPTVTCSGNGTSGCNDGTNIPSLITMNLSIRDVDNPGGTPYTIAVSGQRRQT